ncbi:MAG TPA: hypothetical protein VF701_01610 [Thermoanaerobaculia bacterium]
MRGWPVNPHDIRHVILSDGTACYAQTEEKKLSWESASTQPRSGFGW